MRYFILVIKGIKIMKQKRYINFNVKIYVPLDVMTFLLI